jgi:hypothetical protein
VDFYRSAAQGKSLGLLRLHLAATLRFVTFDPVSLVFVTIGLEICDFCCRPALIFVTVNPEICDLCTLLQGPLRALKIVTFQKCLLGATPAAALNFVTFASLASAWNKKELKKD